MIEVELKFEISPTVSTQLQARLEDMPLARRIGQAEVVDMYYDTASFTCLQRAVFLRIRNHAYLEIKFHEDADPEHIHSTERVFPLTSGPSQIQEMNALCASFVPGWRDACTVKSAFHTNGLMEFAYIKKQRTQYAYENLILCIDHVEGLGDFFEVEAHCQDGTDSGRVAANLDGFVAGLAFPTLRPVSIGYVELWLRQHLPQIYQLGKYQVENYFEWSYAL